MEKLKNQSNKLPYIIFGILSLFSVSLIFNNNLWFDESYTLSLIQHDFPKIIEILKTDMHPPLYFLSLKVFCMISVTQYISQKSFLYLAILQHFHLA